LASAIAAPSHRYLQSGAARGEVFNLPLCHAASRFPPSIANPIFLNSPYKQFFLDAGLNLP
jgi:hypothetical protein